MKKLTQRILFVLSMTFLIFALCACQNNTITEGEFSFSDYSHYVDELPGNMEWDLSEEKITNAQTAIEAAKKVLSDPYNVDSDFGVSWEVLYDSSEDVWLVRKHKNSTSTAIIMDSDGMLITSQIS